MRLPFFLFVAVLTASAALAAASTLLACSDDDDYGGSSVGDAAAIDGDADGGLDAGDADAGLPCPDGGQLVYGGEYCEIVGASVVTASTTRLELSTALPELDGAVPGIIDGGDSGVTGCSGTFADITFDIPGQTATSASCASAGSGGFLFRTQTLSLTPAQTAAMLAAWTEIREVTFYEQTVYCGEDLAEYPALVTRTDRSGTLDFATCGDEPSDIYDDFKALNDILAFFDADGGS